MDKPHQRKGSASNTQVGRDFEGRAQRYFAGEGLNLKKGVSIKIGISGRKAHSFDLGDADRKILVECKAHTWTEGGNVPSAKITSWNQAMFCFYATPPGFRKILVVLRDFSKTRGETLGQYYIRSNSHLIPRDVEIWELHAVKNRAVQIKEAANRGRQGSRRKPRTG